MKRDAAQTIFRTVVFAGAMLGAGACGKKPAPAAPTNTTEAGKAGDGGKMMAPKEPAAADPCAANPCGDVDPCGRPRGVDEDGGGGAGRGFILS
jgi:hypothetical protein